MGITQLQKNNHLLLRAGFGPKLSQFENASLLKEDHILKELFKNYSFQFLVLEENLELSDYQSLEKKEAVAKKAALKKNRKQNLKINLSFLDQMVSAEDQLREKMAFFWHGHFATRVGNPRFNLHLLNILREKGLGDFGGLLRAVSQSPSMLQFLNNQQNKKGHPNENFAREVMELFTLGRGNYTETDVKEAARAFTGWSFSPDGTFFERPNQHDFGSKTFLGKTGNLDGKEVLQIILDQNTTATFITTKIYKFFVSEKVDPQIIDDLSAKFFASNYNIKELLQNIFTSSWFYNEENVGTKIKSPIELIAGMRRILPMHIEKPENLIVYQKLLGQMLLYPPNVSGWPSGKSWIDSSTLMLRLQMPQIWAGYKSLAQEPKSDDDVEMGMENAQKKATGFKNANIIIDWEKVEKVFYSKNIEDYLLQRKSLALEKTLEQYSGSSVQSRVINVMSTPEFQMM
jgi:uncharacterized protein (DUF1800 family)